MAEFSALKEAIDSWYAHKVNPSIIVVLKKGTKVCGCLLRCEDDEIVVVIDEPKKTQTIHVSDIDQIELSWNGVDLPEMGELDGTGMDGMSLPTACWRHRITRIGKNGWLFQDVSKTPGLPYEGERHKEQQRAQ